MTTRSTRKITVTLTLQCSDVVAMIDAAKLVPQNFGKFWAAELKTTGDGGLEIKLTEELNIENPKLGRGAPL